MVNTAKEGGPFMVLNDFDLAAVVSPGDKSPKKGFEMTGTKPFMALELLKNSFGTVKRLCRHDLESVIWVLVWLCRKAASWYNDTPEDVFDHKMAYPGWAIPRQKPQGIDQKFEDLWYPVTKIVTAWGRQWGDASQEEELESLSEDQLLDAIQQFLPCPKRYGEWDWRHFKVVSQL